MNLLDICQLALSLKYFSRTTTAKTKSPLSSFSHSGSVQKKGAIQHPFISGMMNNFLHYKDTKQSSLRQATFSIVFYRFIKGTTTATAYPLPESRSRMMSFVNFQDSLYLVGEKYVPSLPKRQRREGEYKYV